MDLSRRFSGRELILNVDQRLAGLSSGRRFSQRRSLIVAAYELRSLKKLAPKVRFVLQGLSADEGKPTRLVALIGFGFGVFH